MYQNLLACLLMMQFSVGYIQFEASNEFSEIEAGKLSEEPITNRVKLRSMQILEDLVKRNSQAYKLWNITYKYKILDPSNIKQVCFWELQRNKQLITVYMVNITFNSSVVFLEDFTINEFKHYSGNELKYARKFYENRTKVAEDMDEYISISKNVSNYKRNDKSDELVCVSSTICGCVHTSYFESFDEELDYFKTHTDYLLDFIVFGSYIEPVFRMMIIFAGVILNGVLLYIFYKEHVVRSEYNIMIFNLAVSNVLMLIFYTPTNYIGTYHLEKYGSNSNKGIVAIEILVVTANTLTILFLNIQRYFDVCRVLNPDQVKCHWSPTSRCITYSSVLWSCCFLFSISSLLLDLSAAQSIKVIVYFLVYLFLFSIALAVFNSMTARRLQRSAERGIVTSDLKHIAGSGVILYLTASFYVTHFPFFISSTYEGIIDWVSMDFYNSLTTRTVAFIFHVIHLSYPCMTVMILHKASSMYRFFLNAYLFHCWYNPQDRQYLTMSSVQSTESRGLNSDNS